jgi:hypothetical protein
MAMSFSACGTSENTKEDNNETTKADTADKAENNAEKDVDDSGDIVVSVTGISEKERIKIVSGDTEAKFLYECFIEGASDPTLENLTSIIGKEPSSIIERSDEFHTIVWSEKDMVAGINIDFNPETGELIKYTFDGAFLMPYIINKVQEWCSDAVLTEDMGNLVNDEGDTYTYEDFCEIFKSKGTVTSYIYNEAGELCLHSASWNDIDGDHFRATFDVETGLSTSRSTSLPHDLIIPQ